MKFFDNIQNKHRKKEKRKVESMGDPHHISLDLLHIPVFASAILLN